MVALVEKGGLLEHPHLRDHKRDSEFLRFAKMMEAALVASPLVLECFLG